MILQVRGTKLRLRLSDLRGRGRQFFRRFRIESLETGYLKAPRAMGFVYSGSARPN